MPSHNLFVYGSLLHDSVISLIVGNPVVSVEATLDGFERRPVVGSAYPAIIPRSNAQVRGKVLYGLSDEAMTILDEYEEIDLGLYFKKAVEVATVGGSLPAIVYVAGPKVVLDHAHEWNPDAFDVSRYIEEVVEPYLRWRAERRP